MCIIAYKPAGKTIDKQTLQTCFTNNPDGAGFMFPNKGKVLIHKGFFTFPDFWVAWEKVRKAYGNGLPVVFHFRIATAGEIDRNNCHPHRITQELAFVHNGILSCVNVPKKSKVSDTILYRDQFLQGMTANTLHDVTLFPIMGGHIGKYNKFVFMNGVGKVAFANEKSGLWDNGIWFSNEAYKPKVLKKKGKKGAAEKLPAFDWWANYRYCEYCGKDLDTPEELEEGLCFSCMAFEGEPYEECGGCDCALTDAAHRLAGWCDKCGPEVYGAEWAKKLAECQEQCDAEAINPEGKLD